ncbi:MAG: molybdopterin-dependent oxidoreductase, partial [Myxococcales bacterium]|nr:molybdopterin-dependent oxidoreductase [Myxococcales bacterium]
TGAQEQLYIEPQGVIARFDEQGGLTIWGSMQCPYYIHNALKILFGLGDDDVRVIWCTTGGGFGGKEEYPSMISAHAALLARKAKRPVKLIYDRTEDIRATTKRHPSRTTHRTAVDADGRLLAIDVDFVIDAGAYMTLSPVVLSRGAIHAAGPYACENVRIRARAVATNFPPYGAFRGFGAPQSLFAAERQMDRVAKHLGLEPEELRRRNFLTLGDITATSQTLREEPDFPGLLARAKEESSYDEKRRAYDAHNRHGTSVKKGIGLATFYHGAGFTGSGEVYLSSIAAVRARTDGSVEVLAASTEIGQGTMTIFSQIAAEALGIAYDSVSVAAPDTALVPNSGPTVASRTTMVVGKLVERAAADLLRKLQGASLLGESYDDATFRNACRQYIERHGELRGEAQYEPPPNIVWDDQLYRGDAYGTYAWAVYVAEVEVDTVTYESRVTNFVAAQEIGRVVHPTLAAGQIEGGVAQAIGYSLYEKVVTKDGRVINPQMTNYIMPTSLDVPPIRVFFVEKPYAYGPGGAKGIGELPFDGPAPAIMAAIEHATGVSLDSIPTLPEDLMRAFGEGGAHD